jgi:hypothetical protein
MLFESVDKDMNNVNFIGIQKGDITDVKGNAPNELLTNETKVRSKDNLEVKVYPNPFHTNFNLSVASNQSEKINIIITDLSGRVLINKIVSIDKGQNEIPVETEHLPNGVYIYQIKSSNYLSSGKINKTN